MLHHNQLSREEYFLKLVNGIKINKLNYAVGLQLRWVGEKRSRHRHRLWRAQLCVRSSYIVHG